MANSANKAVFNGGGAARWTESNKFNRQCNMEMTVSKIAPEKHLPNPYSKKIICNYQRFSAFIVGLSKK